MLHVQVFEMFYDFLVDNEAQQGASSGPSMACWAALRTPRCFC